MAVSVAVTCPECEKKFKPKADVQGTRIKCPFCKEPFVVPAAKSAKPDKAKPEKPAPAPPKVEPAPVVAEEPKSANDENDGDNPYGVKTVEMVPRCPNCTAEMENAHAIICLNCGYNTMTREWGRTEKTLGITFGQHLKYLAPALGAAAFVLFSIVNLIYYCVVAPYHVHKSMMEFTDHESLRMWTTVINLGWIFGAGTFCSKKFIEKPKPDEIVIE